LLHGDIARLDLAAMGEFDFIICHGVYSWVPDEVQEAILAACGRLLSPTGVAYVGYNTYPGWRAKEIGRGAMLLSVGDSAKVRRARGMVDFLQKVAQPGSVLGQALDDYQQMAAKTGDYYLLHEELELFGGRWSPARIGTRSGAPRTTPGFRRQPTLPPDANGARSLRPPDRS